MITYVGCLAVHHDSADCPSSGEPQQTWCTPCATRSHLIDDHMACMGAHSPMVVRIAGCGYNDLSELHAMAHQQRITDGRPAHDHARNVHVA